MHQLTHCLTLPKPFFKIFLFRIYAPTVQTHPHHIDPVFAETSVRFPQIHAPIQPPQTNPPTTPSHKYPHPYNPHKPIHQRPQIPTQPRTTNTTTIQSHKHAHSHRKPIHQRHCPHPQPHTRHEFHAHTQPQIPRQYSLHKHHTTIHTHHNRTAPQTHATQPRPPTLTTLTLTPSHRETMPYPDVVAAPTQSQPRSSQQLARPGTRPYKTRQDQAGLNQAVT